MSKYNKNATILKSPQSMPILKNAGFLSVPVPGVGILSAGATGILDNYFGVFLQPRFASYLLILETSKKGM